MSNKKKDDRSWYTIFSYFSIEIQTNFPQRLNECVRSYFHQFSIKNKTITYKK